MALGVGLISPWAPSAVQAERRWRDVSDVYLPIDQPRSLLRMLEQGPESQSASAICAGGVSAVISSSDLDEHTFHPTKGSCHRSNHALRQVHSSMNSVVGTPSAEATVTQTIVGSLPTFST